MLFKKVISKVRRAILCCKPHKRKPSLDIGSPTNVRHIPLTDSLPGLTSTERLYIREKASSDAIHLLGLQTSPPSPSASNPNSHPASRENSYPLLNAASKDLPSALPTPPRATHSECSPPRDRMRGVSTWDFVDEGHRESPSARRLSFSSVESRASGAKVLRKIKVHDNGVGVMRSDSGNQRMTLDMGFEWEDNGEEEEEGEGVTAGSLSEGFEMQDTVGGHAEEGRDGGGKKEGMEEVGARDSDSDEDAGEMRGLVKI